MLKKSPMNASKVEHVKSVALLIATLILIEICLQMLASLPTDNKVIAALRGHTSYGFADNDFVWKKQFLDAYERQSERSSPGLSKLDPELGWIPTQNLKRTLWGGASLTTNSLGFRSLHEYVVDDEERFTVLIVGDSFTFGAGADNTEVWPTILQNLDATIQVINMGVSGYATDQMYLTIKKHIGHFKPDLVIAAFISSDLSRSTVSFRTFEKPKFEIVDGELVLTNTPIPDAEYVAKRLRREIRFNDLVTDVRLFNLVRNAYASIQPKKTSEEEKMQKQAARESLQRLNDLIFGEMIERCKEHDAEFLLLYLPHGDELIDPAFRRFGERYFKQFVKRSKIHGLNPRPLFLASDTTSVQYSMGHYKGPAATVVANAVYRKIMTFPAFGMQH